MDPLSQAVVGGVVPASFTYKKHVRLAVLCGAIGGMSPDLDVLISSNVDPLLALEYHRHFTHSIFMVPVVGFIVAWGLWFLFSRDKVDFKLFYIFTTLGVATHGLLDTCTAYGTYTLWPFSDARYTFMNMSIIDPLFTIPMLLLLVVATIWRKPLVALTSLAFGLGYIGISQYNQNLVEQRVYEEATKRGHNIERIFFNPTIGNNIVWRTVYESGNHYYVDAVRSIPFKSMQFFAGVSVPKVNINSIYPEVPENSQQREDIKRFNKFALGYLYEYKPYILADLRYGLSVNGKDALWGIHINPQTPQEHVQRFRNERDRGKALKSLKQLVLYGEQE